MKLIPRKEWNDKRAIEAQDFEFDRRVNEMINDSKVASEEIEVPPGYFDRRPDQRDRLSKQFIIDDSAERQAAAERKAAADKLEAEHREQMRKLDEQSTPVGALKQTDTSQIAPPVQGGKP